MLLHRRLRMAKLMHLLLHRKHQVQHEPRGSQVFQLVSSSCFRLEVHSLEMLQKRGIRLRSENSQLLVLDLQELSVPCHRL